MAGAKRHRLTPEAAVVRDAVSGRPLRVETSFPPQGWTPRKPGAAHVAPHPGTGLLDGELWHEIVDRRGGDGERQVYVLAPWEEHNVLRVTDELTPEALRRSFARHRDAQQRALKRASYESIAPLVGLLPAEDQERLRDEYGVRAGRATMLSAWPLFLLGIVGLLLPIFMNAGLDLGTFQWVGEWVEKTRILLIVLFVESSIRLILSMRADQAMGSFLVAAPLLAWRTITQPAAFRPPSTRSKDVAALRDTVRPWPGGDADLEVRSRLPKEHWTLNVGGVIYEGQTYIPVAREVLEGDDEPYRFLLKLPEHETLFRYVHEYHPEEAREIERERRRGKAATWVETFSFLWGLVDGNRQTRLEKTYKYNAARTTRLALGGVIFFAVVNLVISVGQMRGGGGVLHALMFFFSLYLLWETALRWSDPRAGRPVRASVLGAPLRGLVDRALRWERNP